MSDNIRDDRARQPAPQDVVDATEAKRRAEAAARVKDDETSGDTDDVSPHHGGRAQPGDVLGLETGGETTAIGETAEDENKRRRDALKK